MVRHIRHRALHRTSAMVAVFHCCQSRQVAEPQRDLLGPRLKGVGASQFRVHARMHFAARSDEQRAVVEEDGVHDVRPGQRNHDVSASQQRQLVEKRHREPTHHPHGGATVFVAKRLCKLRVVDDEGRVPCRVVFQHDRHA
eukprot:547458-Rhodomonas_salina.2